MDSLIISPENADDLELLKKLVRKMGYKYKILSDEEKEDLGMIKLLEEANDAQKVSREEIMNAINTK